MNHNGNAIESRLWAAADELRAFVYLYEQTKLPQFLWAAQRFGDWHLRTQREDGAWLLTIDRFENPVSEYVGPGDIPNIATALLRLQALQTAGRLPVFDLYAEE